MKNILKIFIAMFLTLNMMPVFAAGGNENSTMEAVIENESTTNTPQQTDSSTTTYMEDINVDLDFSDPDPDFQEEASSLPPEVVQYAAEHLDSATDQRQTESQQMPLNTDTNKIPDTDVHLQKEKEDDLEKKQQAYDEAKATEQSKENRILTSLSTVATGIGGMELAEGLAEQKADKAAEQDMAAYISTMRCKYGDTLVKAGNEEIELPGGNSADLMKYRAEYLTLAADLKERKTALNMKPGIESEEILDKSQTDLYAQENIGISDGAYASIYRAQMLGSEKDQEQIDDAAKTSKTRVIGGAVAGGVGVVGGMVGDSLVNGKLGEKIQENKNTIPNKNK